MKIVKIILVLMMAVFTKSQAQGNEKSILGFGNPIKKDVRMEFFKNGDQYNARLLWGNLIVEKDGVTSKKDSKNPNKLLRNRNIIGIVSLTGLKWDGQQFSDGKIYDPPSGDTYTCKAWIENGKLSLRGFLGISLLGKTVTWHRYKL